MQTKIFLRSLRNCTHLQRSSLDDVTATVCPDSGHADVGQRRQLWNRHGGCCRLTVEEECKQSGKQATMKLRGSRRQQSS